VAEQKISVVMDTLLEQVRLLSAQIDDFPEPAALTVTQGEGVGVTAAFHHQIKGLAGDLGRVAIAVREELHQTEAAVRATARDMADTDAAIADGARKIVEQLEGIDSPPTPVPTPAGKPSTGTFK
jgi:hypothetical protein